MGILDANQSNLS